jgi:hypothetical protein
VEPFMSGGKLVVVPDIDYVEKFKNCCSDRWSLARIAVMDTPKYVFLEEQGKWRGYLQGYPDYSAQGESFDELQFKLGQLCRDLLSGKPSNIRKIA